MKFVHSMGQAGYLYCHKTAGSPISDREGLKAALNEASEKLGLDGSTIKIYRDIFFLFFRLKPEMPPIQIISSVHQGILPFGSWHPEYMLAGVNDLQEKCLRKGLKNAGFDYDKGG